jgi:hypothetical protein
MENLIKSKLFWFVVGGVFFKYCLDILDMGIIFLSNKQQLNATLIQKKVNSILGNEEQESNSTNAIGFNLDFEEDYEDDCEDKITKDKTKGKSYEKIGFRH